MATKDASEALEWFDLDPDALGRADLEVTPRATTSSVSPTSLVMWSRIEAGVAMKLK